MFSTLPNYAKYLNKLTCTSKTHDIPVLHKRMIEI